MDDIKKDDRFSHIAKDPRFRQMGRKSRKVHIDKRFQSMFGEKKFKLKYMVDKRGRPDVSTTSENLKDYYECSSESHSDSDEDETINIRNEQISPSGKTTVEKEKKRIDKIRTPKLDGSFQLPTKKSSRSDRAVNLPEKGDEKPDLSDDDEIDDDKKIEEDDSEESDSSSDNSITVAADGPDFARGEGNISSTDDEDDIEFDQDKFDHQWGEIDHDAPTVESITHRLAICNMDWDRIKANDLLVLLGSFKPSGASIKSVKIYPSEFGKQRMAEEDLNGPQELRVSSDHYSSSKEEFNHESLREYQLKRLKYYYAVLECDCAATANAIYEECDGMEYESSATKLDLRFIPDDMTFDDEPKSVATETLDPATYKPTLFLNTALQQSKVELTWDEDNPDRSKITRRNFTKEEVEELDVQDYLASESDGDVAEDQVAAGECGETEEEQIQKYRALLTGLDDKKPEKDVEMQISWEPGLRETIDNKASIDPNLTPWEQFLEKKKQKKEQKLKNKSKPQVAALNNEEEDDDLPQGVDLNDPYFAEELKAKNMEDKQKKKKRKKKMKKLTPEEEKEQSQQQAELAMLMMDEDEDHKEHFSLKAIQQKQQHQQQHGGSRKAKKKLKKALKAGADLTSTQDQFQMDVGDSRFKAVFDNPMYNIDPSAPEFKQTEAMDTLIQTKIKRKSSKTDTFPQEEDKLHKKHKLKADDKAKYVDGAEHSIGNTSSSNQLASLVNSVKAKTLQHSKKARWH